jgi:hypothetical protein
MLQMDDNSPLSQFLTSSEYDSILNNLSDFAEISADFLEEITTPCNARLNHDDFILSFLDRSNDAVPQRYIDDIDENEMFQILLDLERTEHGVHQNVDENATDNTASGNYYTMLLLLIYF